MKKILLSTLALSVSLFAQDMKENPIAAVNANFYKSVSTNITKSIEKMPADKFSFKAVDGTMPFSEFVGHLTDANNSFCSAVTGGPKVPSVRKETSKEVLAKAWAAAVAECTKAYTTATDKSLAGMIKMGQREVPASQPLTLNLVHSFEHYGNLVTLLRMNGLVPPSSEGR